MMIVSGLMVTGLQIKSVDSSSGTCLLQKLLKIGRLNGMLGVASVVGWRPALLRDH